MSNELNRDEFRYEELFQAFMAVVTDLLALVAAMFTRVFVHGGLDVATTTTKFKTSGTTNYMIDGVHYAKAATDNIATPNGNTIVGEYRKDLITLDAAGSFTVTAGTVAASQAAANLPNTPAGGCPIGHIEVPASFTAGTDSVTAGMLKAVTEGVTLGTTIGS